MTAVNVRGKLMEEISLVGDARGPEVPEVVMGITDGDLGLQGGLRGQGEPVIASERYDCASAEVFGG